MYITQVILSLWLLVVIFNKRVISSSLIKVTSIVTSGNNRSFELTELNLLPLVILKQKEIKH